MRTVKKNWRIWRENCRTGMENYKSWRNERANCKNRIGKESYRKGSYKNEMGNYKTENCRNGTGSYKKESCKNGMENCRTENLRNEKANYKIGKESYKNEKVNWKNARENCRSKMESSSRARARNIAERYTIRFGNSSGWAMNRKSFDSRGKTKIRDFDGSHGWESCSKIHIL
jgi:hypothetical protein